MANIAQNIDPPSGRSTPKEVARVVGPSRSAQVRRAGTPVRACSGQAGSGQQDCWYPFRPGGIVEAMYFIVARLTGHRPVTDTECSQLQEQLLHPSDGATVQHVYARPSESGADVVLFVTAGTLETAEGTAESMLAEALAGNDVGLTVSSCVVDLFLPGAEAALRDGRSDQD